MLINVIIIYFFGNFIEGTIRRVDLGKEAAQHQLASDVQKLWRRFNIFFWIFLILPFSVYLQIVFPISDLIGIIATTRIVSAVGIVITLGYFGYAITLKKYYLVLGLLAIF